MSTVNDDYPTHVASQLGMALSVAKSLMEAETAAEKPKLRGSHLRLLSLTPADGIRPTALAARVGMTKQSLGEFVAALEQAGYLQVEIDPQDRRARIVSPTTKGRKLQSRLNEIITELEQRWENQVGPRNWATFRRVLTQIAGS
jgi:DNA-binding MarR family transcriptional regulator